MSRKTTGAAAIGFALAIVLLNVVMVPAGLPLTGAGAAQVTAFFSAQGDLVGVASMLTPAAWVLATLFGAGVLAAVRGAGAGWAIAGLAGLTLQNGAFAGVVALRLALAAAPGEAGGLWALHDAVFTLNGTFLALALLGLSAGGIRAGLIRRWHAGLGLVAAALLFTSATLTPFVMEHGGALGLIGLVGWLLWVGWIVGYGVVLIRSAPDREVAPVAA